MRKLPQLLLFFLLLPLLSVHARSVAVYRAGVAIGTYTDLHTALNNTLSNDSLLLSADTFSEHHLIIEKPLVIQGTIDGSGKTVIAGFADSSVFVLQHPAPLSGSFSVLFRDVAIWGGRAHLKAFGSSYAGSGIAAFDSVVLILAGKCHIHDCLPPLPGQTLIGGGIYCRFRLMLQDSVLIDACTAGSGGGIYASELIAAKDVRIERNTALSGRGGGIYGHRIQLKDRVLIQQNRATLDGGGIYAEQLLDMKDSVQLLNCVSGRWGGGAFALKSAYLSGNCSLVKDSAETGGAIYSDSLLRVSGCRFLNNYAIGAGGAVFLSRKADIRSHTLFEANVARQGAALGIRDGDTVMLSDSLQIIGNRAINTGGAIQCGSSTLLLERVQICNNISDSDRAAAIGVNGGSVFANHCLIYHNKSLRVLPKVPFGPMSAITIDAGFTAPTIFSVRNSHIYNPSAAGLLQAEILSYDKRSVILSDSCWWGRNDTLGLVSKDTAARFIIPSWVQTHWTFNNGLPASGLSSAQIRTYFTLNRGDSLLPGTLPSLSGRYLADSGYFSMGSGKLDPDRHILLNVYVAPYFSRPTQVWGIVDADTFSIKLNMAGTELPERSVYEPLRVFPHPDQGQLSFTLAETGTLMIFDVMGRLHRQHAYTYSGSPIQQSLALSPGIYWLQFTGADGRDFGQRVLVQ
jgi:predicted outer membrane repeat protein